MTLISKMGFTHWSTRLLSEFNRSDLSKMSLVAYCKAVCDSVIKEENICGASFDLFEDVTGQFVNLTRSGNYSNDFSLPVSLVFKHFSMDFSQCQRKPFIMTLDPNSQDDLSVFPLTTKSIALFPIINTDRIIGYFSICASNLNAFHQVEMEAIYSLMSYFVLLYTLKSTSVNQSPSITWDKLSLAINQCSETIVITDLRGNIEYVNDEFERSTGYKAQDVLGKNPRVLQSGKTTRDTYRDLWKTLRSGERWQGEFINRKSCGSEYVEFARITPIRQENGDGSVTHYMAIKKDITETTATRNQVEKLAYYDSLTGLPNRALFLKRLKKLLNDDAGSSQLPLSLMFIDLDHFKEINDTQGHDHGDCLLQTIGQTIRSILESHHTLARLGGDEFVVIAPDTDAEQAQTIAYKLHQTISQPIPLKGQNISVGASIGITVCEKQGPSVSTLLKQADIAMYRAKAQGNGFCLYLPEMELALNRKITLARKLLSAIRQDKLALNFQPFIDLNSQQCVGAEVLLRWFDDDLGWISPAEFIPLAEERHLVSEISNWVIRHTCRQMLSWQNQGYVLNGRLSINISAQEIGQESCAQRIIQLVEEEGISPYLLDIEITESAVVVCPHLAEDNINQLAKAGFTVSIDDFGTGYSSLSKLKHFSVNKLKIDRSFISELLIDDANRKIVTAIIAVAKSLCLQLVAEGVEDKQQEALLSEMGCDFAQGFLYTKPIPSEQFAQDWLQVNN
ncbi:TPA: putative bifunctional diguanylate cyclase/phosphodiesterase [Photobacterium damselae]